MELVESRIQAGRWTGLVRLDGPSPGFAVTLGDRALAGLREEPAGDGLVRLVLDLPATLIDEGLQPLLLTAAGRAEVLGRFVLFAGAAVEGDAAAEVALIRAELDLLKAAFRRHCAATGG